MGNRVKIVIDGIPPWDGSYEFEDFNFTNREFFRIKEISGIRAGELIEALEAGDTGAYVGVAAVVLTAQGKILQGDVDALWNGPVGSITLDLRDGVADPPTQTGSENEPSPSDGSSGSGSAPVGV